MTESSEICIAYGLWHIDEARTHAARGMTIVCFDSLVERELTKENIPCISLRDVIDSETGEEEWWLRAHEVAREWYRLPAMKFFKYRDIPIGEALEPILMAEYLMKLFYYARIYTALKKMYPDARLSIPVIIKKDEPTAECLVSLERRAVVDAARMAGFQIITLDKPVAPYKRAFFRTVLKSLFVRIYNALISFAPRRSIKIYASEYWSHIGPVMEQMDDGELVLVESGELTHIPWRQLFKHRIRTRHPRDEIRGAERTAAVQILAEFMEQWEIAKKDVAEYLLRVRGELDWSPVLEAFEYLVAYAPRIIAEIDALHRIMEEEKPDIVLQLASVSDRQHQFFLTARVAAQLKVSSVELQHSAMYMDPRSAFSRIETDYLATYGADTNSWHERIGHARERLIAVGSPRFDQCINERGGAIEKGKQLFTQLGLDAKRPVLLAAVPFSDANLFHADSYQLADFFKAIHAAQSAIPGMQVLFKCRNHKYVDITRKHIQGLFIGDSVIVGGEDIFPLLCASDAVVCNNSTVIYQTMLAKKPLVLYPWKSFETYDARVYAPAPPLARTSKEVVDVIARMFTDASYRDGLLVRQKDFLGGYSFNGKSSERMGAFIRRLSRKQNGTTSY